MLQTIQFPAGVTNLNASLTDMDGDTFTLRKQKEKKARKLILRLRRAENVTNDDVSQLFIDLRVRFAHISQQEKN